MTTTTETSLKPAARESAEAAAGQTHQKKEVMKRTDAKRFVGGQMGYVYLSVRPTRHVGGSLGQVEAW